MRKNYIFGYGTVEQIYDHSSFHIDRATPRRPTLAMKEKPMDEWSVEEWVAFMQGRTQLR
jgi:hypothetical protein